MDITGAKLLRLNEAISTAERLLSFLVEEREQLLKEMSEEEATTASSLSADFFQEHVRPILAQSLATGLSNKELRKRLESKGQKPKNNAAFATFLSRLGKKGEIEKYQPSPGYVKWRLPED